jgi:hypothetical protein
VRENAIAQDFQFFGSIDKLKILSNWHDNSQLSVIPVGNAPMTF